MPHGFSDDDYFHVDTSDGRQHRGTPPTANGRALDTWDRDLAAHIVHCPSSTPTEVEHHRSRGWVRDSGVTIPARVLPPTPAFTPPDRPVRASGWVTRPAPDCIHGYRLTDSCPGCDALDEDPPH